MVLAFIQKLEKQQKKNQEIMSFSGIWKDMDETFLESMTTKLAENRI